MKNIFSIALLLLAFAFGASAQDAGNVKGKIRAASGKSLSDATITARQNGKEIKSVKTDQSGNFQMTGLTPGVYNFVFDKTGFATGVKYDVRVEKNTTIDLGDRLILSVDPGILVFVKGSVFLPDGRSFPGAEIKIERLAADGKTKKVGSAVSDEVGEFAFRFSDTGNVKYRVTASTKGVTDSQEIDVTNAAVYRVALTLSIKKDK